MIPPHLLFRSGLRTRLLRTTACASIVFIAAACAARAPLRTPVNSERYFVAGYHAYWAKDGWTKYPLDALTELYFFELEVNATGGFLNRHGWPGEWQAMVRAAQHAGVQVTPTISMHDVNAFQQLFASDAAIDQLVGNIETLVHATPGLAGVHLDFEVFQRIQPAARSGYASFVGRLAGRLRKLDRGLTLSVFALAFDDSDAYDERALADAAEYLVVQGYDYHSRGGDRAGPTAAVAGWGRLNWTNVVARFDALGVPRRRIVMSVPLYGYEWPTLTDAPGARTRGPGVPMPLTAPPDVLPELPRAFERASRHGVRRDSVSGSPYYAFRDQTGWFQGWFEDAESLAAKYEFVRRNELGGIALFPLVYGNEALWRGLRDAFRGNR